MATKQVKYIPLDYENPDTLLNLAAAFVQAAQVLDIAAQDAIQCKDRNTLTDVAALWIRLGEGLKHETEDDEPENEYTGFKIKDPERDQESTEDEDDADNTEN